MTQRPFPAAWRIVAYLLALIAVPFQIGVALASISSRVNSTNIDFHVFYRVSQAMHDGHVRDIYDPHINERFPDPGSFYHFPEELPLIYLLAFFSRATAFYLWTSLNVAAVLIACLLLPKNPVIPLPLLACAFFPMLAMISEGQDSGILLLLIAGAFRFFTGGREIASAVLLALALFKFQYAIPLALSLALTGRHHKLAVSFAAATLAVAAAVAAVMGTTGIASYVGVMRSHDYQIGSRMVNLRGLAEGIGAPGWFAIFISAAMLAYFLLFAAKIPDRASLFAAAVALSFLVSHHGHIYDALLLLIPASVLLREQHSAWIAVLFAASPALIYLWTDNLLYVFALVPLALLIRTLHVAKIMRPTAAGP